MAKKTALILTFLWSLASVAIGGYAFALAAPKVDRVSYDVLRDGSRIGHYDFEITRHPGAALTVTSRMEVAVDLLFITVYRATHEAVTHWHAGRLQELRGWSDYNGNKYNIALDCADEVCRLAVNSTLKEITRPVVPLVPWRIDGQDQFTLVTEKGKLREVEARYIGRETVVQSGAAVTSDHYLLTGDVERVLWYGPDGRLLRIRYRQGGTEIEIALNPARSRTARPGTGGD